MIKKELSTLKMAFFGGMHQRCPSVPGIALIEMERDIDMSLGAQVAQKLQHSSLAGESSEVEGCSTNVVGYRHGLTMSNEVTHKAIVADGYCEMQQDEACIVSVLHHSVWATGRIIDQKVDQG